MFGGNAGSAGAGGVGVERGGRDGAQIGGKDVQVRDLPRARLECRALLVSWADQAQGVRRVHRPLVQGEGAQVGRPLPECRAEQMRREWKPLAEVEPTAASILGAMRIYCPAYRAAGCTWTGDYSNAQAHLDKTCPYALTKCEFCGKSCRTAEFADHQKACKQWEKCRFCGQQFVNTDRAVHQGLCRGALVGCPNACGVTLARQHVSLHRWACPKEPISCPLAFLTQCDRVPRHLLADHLSDEGVHLQRWGDLMPRTNDATDLCRPVLDLCLRSLLLMARKAMPFNEAVAFPVMICSKLHTMSFRLGAVRKTEPRGTPAGWRQALIVGSFVRAFDGGGWYRAQVIDVDPSSQPHHNLAATTAAAATPADHKAPAASAAAAAAPPIVVAELPASGAAAGPPPNVVARLPASGAAAAAPPTVVAGLPASGASALPASASSAAIAASPVASTVAHALPPAASATGANKWMPTPASDPARPMGGRVRVTYPGYGSSYDEWLDRHGARLAWLPPDLSGADAPPPLTQDGAAREGNPQELKWHCLGCTKRINSTITHVACDICHVAVCTSCLCHTRRLADGIPPPPTLPRHPQRHGDHDAQPEQSENAMSPDFSSFLAMLTGGASSGRVMSFGPGAAPSVSMMMMPNRR